MGFQWAEIDATLAITLEREGGRSDYLWQDSGRSSYRPIPWDGFLKKEPGQGLGLLTKTLGVKPLVLVL